MKNTILSQKEADLLENLLFKYGVVVSFTQIFEELKEEKSKQEIYNLTSKLAKRGWLVRIRRGIYYIAGLESRGTTSLSVFVIANILEKDSYVSFEAALQYHGMFDQYLRKINCVSLKRNKTATVQKIEYEFFQTDKKLFYGFEEKWEGKQKIKVATAEKAILDILSFKRSDYMADLVLEKLRDYQHFLDIEKLVKLSKKQNLAVKRTLGFLLDKAGIETEEFHKEIKNFKGYNKLTTKADIFNAKWRLYHSNHFAKKI